MATQPHYIEYFKSKSNPQQLVRDYTSHFAARYQLGSALFISQHPKADYKLATQQWKKLTRQLQDQRRNLVAAEQLLQTTRTISRMQRVVFTTDSPATQPDAQCYFITPDQIDSLPINCYTIYLVSDTVEAALYDRLPAESLVVSAKALKNPILKDKQLLVKELRSQTDKLVTWLYEQSIPLADLASDMQLSNEALDKLLSSNKLRSEFCLRAEIILHTHLLASPTRLEDSFERLIASLQTLDSHVRALSPVFLTDHLLDNQSDDAFLLRDIAFKGGFRFDTITDFITQQYKLGHKHLAAALEQKAGFLRI